jgi:hypothetical protein
MEHVAKCGKVIEAHSATYLHERGIVEINAHT